MLEILETLHVGGLPVGSCYFAYAVGQGMTGNEECTIESVKQWFKRQKYAHAANERGLGDLQTSLCESLHDVRLRITSPH